MQHYLPLAYGVAAGTVTDVLSGKYFLQYYGKPIWERSFSEAVLLHLRQGCQAACIAWQPTTACRLLSLPGAVVRAAEVPGEIKAKVKSRLLDYGWHASVALAAYSGRILMLCLLFLPVTAPNTPASGLQGTGHGSKAEHQEGDALMKRENVRDLSSSKFVQVGAVDRIELL